jgi:hypothetical protein
MSKRSRAVAFLAAHLAVIPAVRADETREVVVPVAEPDAHDDDRGHEAAPDRWYGGSVLLANVVGLGAAGGCLAWEESPACVAPLLAAGPAVHAAHGNYGRAALSFAAHVALPSLGAILGADATRTCDSSTSHLDGGTITTTTCSPSTDGLATGVWLGIAAAAVVDAALAYDDAHGPPRKTTVRRTPAVMPAMAIGRSDAVVGLQGRF